MKIVHGKELIVITMDPDEFETLQELTGLGSMTITYDRDLPADTKEEMKRIASLIESYELT